jgi:hypothetical protein
VLRAAITDYFYGEPGLTAQSVALGTARGRSCASGGCWGWRGSNSRPARQRRERPEFGYAGSGDNRSTFPKARVWSHWPSAEPTPSSPPKSPPYSVGERTLAARLLPGLRTDELLTADRGFYSWPAWDARAATGAALPWRPPTQLELPVVKVLDYGTFLPVLIAPTIRGRRRERLLAARAGVDLPKGSQSARFALQAGKEWPASRTIGPAGMNPHEGITTSADHMSEPARERDNG